MNREIKFRAWSKTGNRMIDLHAVTPFALDKDLKQDGVFIPFSDDFVNMQYTGLKDKNGKEIYEGDIMKSDDGAVVQLYWDLCGFSSKVIKKSESINTNYFANLWQSRDFEVIGNIYQNPDLLK